MYLNSSRIYGCKNCKTHLSNHDDIISRVSLWVWTMCIRATNRCSCSKHNTLNPGLLPSRAGLPRPAWQGVPVRLRRQYHTRRARGAEHDDREAYRARHQLQAVQGDCRVEVRQGIRVRREVQRRQIYLGGRAAVPGFLKDFFTHIRVLSGDSGVSEFQDGRWQEHGE